MHIMSYRAKMIGGTLDIERDARQRGTVVTCIFPVRSEP